MQLRDALDQVSQIRSLLAQTAVFRGYRSLTIGFSGVLGAAAAVAQAIWLPTPLQQLDAYLALWCGVATISVIVVGAEIWYRARTASALARERSALAIERFVPCLVVGALLTIVIADRATAAAWMFPGLWALLFSLGVFASQRLLPRPVVFVGLFYLVGGTIALAAGPAALTPWSMGLIFGGGQLLAAVILYLTLERADYVRESQE